MSFRLRRYHSRFAPQRSSHSLGCLLALLAALAAYLLFAYTDLRALAVQAFPLRSGPPAASVSSADLRPADPETTPGRPTLAPQRPASTSAAALAGAAASVESTPPSPPTPTLPAALRPSASIPVSDLVFLSHNRLMLWDRRAHQSRPLAENVLDFLIAADAPIPTALLLRPAGPAADGRPRVSLASLELAAGQETALLADTLQPERLDLAAPGRRLAYIQTDGPTRIYTLDLEPGAAPQVVGVCVAADDQTPAAAVSPSPAQSESPMQPALQPAGGACTSLAWSPDGRSLAWSDARGVWLLEPGAAKPRLAHDHRVQVIDPQGKTSLYAAGLHELRWSPDVRFILLRVAPHASAARWDAVLDVRTGYLASLIDSFALQPGEAHADWFNEVAVLVAHAGDPQRQKPPFIHLWHVFATNPELLVSGKQYDLYSDHFPFSPGASKAIPAHALDWVTVATDEKILLGVKLPATEARPVTFSLDLQTGKLARLETLPVDVLQVLWAPDGSGALIHSAGGQFYFTSLAGPGLFDLQAVLQPDAAHPTWLAPSMPRKTPR